MPTSLALLALGYFQGGSLCWLQETNYLVAAVPLAMGLAGLAHFRQTRNPSSRLRGAVFLAAFWAFFAYSWMRVQEHKENVANLETAMTPIIEALSRYHASHDAYPESLQALGLPFPVESGIEYARRAPAAYTLLFHHNIIRRHAYDSDRKAWQDGC